MDRNKSPSLCYVTANLSSTNDNRGRAESWFLKRIRNRVNEREQYRWEEEDRSRAVIECNPSIVPVYSLFSFAPVFMVTLIETCSYKGQSFSPPPLRASHVNIQHPTQNADHVLHRYAQ